MEELLIVTTGGTIDKVYFDDKSDFQVGEPQIGRILEELGVAFRFSVIGLLRKDSLHLDAADRELLRDAIAARAGDPWDRHDGRDGTRTGGDCRQDDRADWRAEPGTLSRFGCRVQRRHGRGRRAIASAGGLHRDERARLGPVAGAQERRGQSLRGAALTGGGDAVHKKTPGNAGRIFEQRDDQ